MMFIDVQYTLFISFSSSGKELYLISKTFLKPTVGVESY